MLEEITIENFRGIRKGEIKELSQINVFIGRNNVGKSSILEAIYYASAMFNETDLIYGFKIDWLLRRRGRKRGYNSLHYLYNPQNKIQLRFKVDEFTFHIVDNLPLLRLPESLIKDSFIYYDLKTRYLRDKNLNFITSPDEKIKEYAKKAYDRIKFFNETFFVDSSLVRDFRMIEHSLWKDIVINRMDKELVKLVREGFNLNVEDFSFLPSLGGNNYCLIAKLPTYSVDVDDLGDGVRHALVIAIVLLKMGQQGMLLIEEPENHQHPGGLYTILSFMVKTIKDKNIQVFISTHSIEVIKYLENISREEGTGLSIFFIERDDEDILTYRKISEIDREVLENLGIDVRFLDII